MAPDMTPHAPTVTSQTGCGKGEDVLILKNYSDTISNLD